jgi:hypothetical protein
MSMISPYVQVGNGHGVHRRDESGKRCCIIEEVSLMRSPSDMGEGYFFPLGGVEGINKKAMVLILGRDGWHWCNLVAPSCMLEKTKKITDGMPGKVRDLGSNMGGLERGIERDREEGTVLHFHSRCVMHSI